TTGIRDGFLYHGKHYHLPSLTFQPLPFYDVLEGTHLVEIQVNGSPFYTAMSYQFAIKIEPTPTPSPTPTTP
ncbi:MAG: hypothetical protein MUE54_03445, partial [Anaerolineae bacterium]|nr:hypothetical protein [Anaerolineae bacterium]